MFHVKFDEGSKTWSSCGVPSVLNPNISIGHILLRSMELNGSKIAQINEDSGEQLTFKDLRLKTIRAAQNLQARSYKSNQIFGIMAENVAHLSPIVFASLCLGCPVNALHTEVEKPNIIRMFGMTEPSIVLCDVKVYDLVVECLTDLDNSAKVFTFNGHKGKSEPVENLFEATGTEEDFVPVEIDGIEHLAAIMSASGTTGQFKGVSISHAILTSSIGNFNLLTANDIFFSFSSMHWITGLIFLLMGTINGATRIATTKEFSPELQMRIIEDYKVTISFHQSYHLVDILKSGLISRTNLSNIKHMVVAGSKMPFNIRKEINSYLPHGSVNILYGLTEMAATVTADFPNHTDEDTVGRLVNGFTVKIIDEHGNRCGINVDGEIRLKSRYKFLGYFKNEQLTKETVDEEGFLLTGDVGHIDKNGYLHLVDRKKELIAYYFKIAPSDIESLLLKSPDIKTACVVGVPYDPVIEIPAAVIVRANESTITEDDVCKLVEDNLVDYCKLRGGVYFVDSIPKTATGKLLRRIVKEIAIKLYKAKQEKHSKP